MRPIVVAGSVCALLLGVTAEAQTLSEVAQRERARREALVEGGRTPRPIELTTSVPETNERARPSRTSPRATRIGAATSWDDRQALRGFAPEIGSDAWSDIYREYLARYRAAENRLERLQLEQREVCLLLEKARGRAGLGAPSNDVVPSAQEDRCSLIPSELARLELERQQIEADCAEDARRRGVLPGRARLKR